MADVETLTQDDLVAIVSVALGNPIRSTAQQDALVRVCRQLDNPFVNWSADAGDTWEGTRCGCGAAIPVMSDNCGDCRKAVGTAWRVTCEDGTVRHEPFATRAEAFHFTAWGHACTSIGRHTIEAVPA